MEFCPETLEERVRKTTICGCFRIEKDGWRHWHPTSPACQQCRSHCECVTAILLDIVSGLIYIHEKGIVHRDLKPQNGEKVSRLIRNLTFITVLYSSVQRRWLLCDFGTSATATSKKLVATSSRRGTGGYRAPEVLDAGVYNNKSDQFSFGCIVFELTFGAKLFRNGDYGVLQFSLNPFYLDFLGLEPDHILNDLEELVTSLIQIDPSARPSAHDTKAVLQSFKF